MEEKISLEIEKNGPFIAVLINQGGSKFYKGFMSPFLREKSVKKMVKVGVKSIGKMDYNY